LSGTANSELINGLAGDDEIWGRGGHDKLYGGVGDDSIWGGDGHDILSGGDGYDNLYGGNGADKILGGGGNDTIVGGSGNDSIIARQGNNIIYFSAGDGQDRVEVGHDDGGTTQLLFRSGITPASLSYQFSGRDLIICVVGSQDQVTLSNFLTESLDSQADDYALFEVRFESDGNAVLTSNTLFAINKRPSAVSDFFATPENTAIVLQVSDLLANDRSQRHGLRRLLNQNTGVYSSQKKARKSGLFCG
jgi:Ca2+-binding RTX toxin-like protein